MTFRTSKPLLCPCRVEALCQVLPPLSRGESPMAGLLAFQCGAALPWPDRDQPGGHRPGRKAGALVVLVDGELVLYVERGGRTLLSWSDDADGLRAAADALALAVRDGALGALSVERADGETVTTTALGAALATAGFHVTPRGLRLRS